MRGYLDEAGGFRQVNGGVSNLTTGPGSMVRYRGRTLAKGLTFDRKMVLTSGLCWNHCRILIRST